VTSNGGVNADLEVVVFVHDQGHFLGGCITSVMRASAYAEARGRSVLLTAVVRAPTPLTSAWVHQRLDTRWRILHSPGSALSQARNLARLAITGRHVAFIDGDDLWCENWLDSAAAAVSREPAIWRPETLITFGSDFHSPAGRSLMFQPIKLDDPSILLSHQILASGFVAPREILMANPWPDPDAERGWDQPDHWWNCNVAGTGHTHRALADTFHYRHIRGAGVGSPTSPRGRIGPTVLARALPAGQVKPGFQTNRGIPANRAGVTNVRVPSRFDERAT
jgi:hypothetical protein